jgi:hypothetical protein
MIQISPIDTFTRLLKVQHRHQRILSYSGADVNKFVLIAVDVGCLDWKAERRLGTQST